MLDHELAGAVWIDGVLWMVLGDRNHLRRPICGTTAGEYDQIGATLAHSLEERQAAAHVVPIIESRIRDGLTDIGKSGEMDDALRPLTADHLS
jgi:hypothetical protein